MRSGKVGPGGQPIKIPVARPVAPGPETSPWYWNPNLVGVRTAPDSFLERLHSELGSELSVTWNPLSERWQVWMQAPRLQSPICRGWKLLFVHEGPDHEYLPLDERVFARLYFASAMQHGNAVKYFDRLCAEIDREKEAAEKADAQDTMDKMTEAAWDFPKIKVGYGPSSGSKFSEFHS